MPIKMRPQIKVGDVVRLSYKGVKRGRGFKRYVKSTLVVIRVDGDGIDQHCKIKCMVENAGRMHEFTSIARGYLWRTGHNVKEGTTEHNLTQKTGSALSTKKTTGKPCSCPWEVVYSSGCKCGGC